MPSSISASPGEPLELEEDDDELLDDEELLDDDDDELVRKASSAQAPSLRSSEPSSNCKRAHVCPVSTSRQGVRASSKIPSTMPSRGAARRFCLAPD